MDDRKIVDLFWKKREAAVDETKKKYEKYCYSIAFGILHSNEDAEECVNDTYVKLWNSIPPKRPRKLSAFIAKVTRNLALDRYDYNSAQKRGGNTEDIYIEFEDCIPDFNSESIADKIALKTAINGFLSSLAPKERKIFMRRYWFFSEIDEIAEAFNLSKSNVKTSLFRTRKKFKDYLTKEEII